MQSVASAQGSTGRKIEPLSSRPHAGLAGPFTELENRVRNNRLNAPEIVAATLRSDAQQPILFVSRVVRAAIRELGSAISKLEIERLVKAAVEARPDAVLEIVRVAVEETPPQLHSNIVSAAVASVPDPYLRVRVRHLQERPYFDSVRFGDETFDGKSFGEGKGPPGEEVLGYEPSDAPDSVTLAEAILGSAIGAGSTAGFDSLFAAVNNVLAGSAGFPNTDQIPLPTPSPVSP